MFSDFVLCLYIIHQRSVSFSFFFVLKSYNYCNHANNYYITIVIPPIKFGTSLIKLTPLLSSFFYQLHATMLHFFSKSEPRVMLFQGRQT